MGLSQGLEFENLARLACNQTSGPLLSLPPQHWNHRRARLPWAFLRMLETELRASCLDISTLWKDTTPQPLISFILKIRVTSIKMLLIFIFKLIKQKNRLSQLQPWFPPHTRVGSADTSLLTAHENVLAAADWKSRLPFCSICSPGDYHTGEAQLADPLSQVPCLRPCRIGLNVRFQ